MTSPLKYLQAVNTTYARLHKTYETFFWNAYMGNAAVNSKKDIAQAKLDAFRSNEELKRTAETLKAGTGNPALQRRLQIWIDFFDQYQMPEAAKTLKGEIDALESRIQENQTTRVEGYVDPKTKTFVKASTLKMRTMMRTDDDESVRQACYVALEKLAVDNLTEYVELVRLRNQFAVLLGYEDFYDYKLRHEDKMSKDELFAIFDSIAEKTTGHFEKIRQLEQTKPRLRKPWNFAYKMTGDFTKQEDAYFPFSQAILRWGKSFSALGIDFKGGTLKLDLLDRAGKYSNGFCHWPDLVRYENGKRIPGSSNFTCNVVPDQVGSGITGYNTLFHEGGHAAHLLNTTQKEVCLNHEYAPMTAAWAETHSMFIDTLFSSPEWKIRYAKNAAGESYPFELFARKERALNLLKPMEILGIIFVCQFEREVYELKNPTKEHIVALARKNHRRFFDQDGDSLWALQIPHLYAWDSACAYHGYGLAKVALAQWRAYFYKQYGYIVDNKHVGKEMSQTWQWGSSKSFSQAVKAATGKKLSSTALVTEINLSAEKIIKRAHQRIQTVEAKKISQKPVDLKASIALMHGTKKIADNTGSFEQMAHRYGTWVQKQKS
jgi:Zn-dependent oligopeptidase